MGRLPDGQSCAERSFQVAAAMKSRYWLSQVRLARSYQDTCRMRALLDEIREESSGIVQ
jgi:hypothetical protein